MKQGKRSLFGEKWCKGKGNNCMDLIHLKHVRQDSGNFLDLYSSALPYVQEVESKSLYQSEKLVK